MRRLGLFLCAALLLAAVPTLGRATHNGNCKDRVRHCVACRLSDPTKCRQCKDGFFPVTYYPNKERCVPCDLNFCAVCAWSDTAEGNRRCVKKCPENCRVCTPDGATCKDCAKGYGVKDGKCEQVFGGVGFCGENNPMGDLWYYRTEAPYKEWEFRDLPKGCWPCEEPAYTKCKDCGFCTPGTAGCTASKNYDGAGRLVGYSRIDGFKCLTCKDGSAARNGRCT